MYRIASALLFILILSSCTQERADLRVMTDLEAMEFIHSHTSGMVEVDEAWKLVFSKPVERKLEELQQFVSVNPKVNMEVHWTSDTEVHLKPTENLKPGTPFSATIDLSALFPSSLTRAGFKLNLYTVQRAILFDKGSFTTEGTTGDLSFEGVLRYWGYGSNELDKPELKVTLGGVEQQVDWGEPAEGSWEFRVKGIQRSAEEQELIIGLEGSSSFKGGQDKVFRIPANGTLEVLQVISPKSTDEPIEVTFSENLDAYQELEGLVKFNGDYSFRTAVNRNVLTIYPDRRKMGSEKVYLTLYPGIRDSKGRELKSQYTSEVHFGSIPPEIKMVDQEHNILPDPKAARISFESVNLKSVVVIVKRIHENNVMQHLQINHMDGNWEMNRVGEIISIERVSLDLDMVSDINQWRRFDIDLTPFIKKSQGAFHHVTLGFDQNDAALTCEDTGLEAIQPLGQDLKSWYTRGYYYRDYDYRERDNPCHSAYYQRYRWKEKMVFATPFAIQAKYGKGKGMSVFVSDILSAAPLEEVSVSVYNFQQRRIGQNRTNSEGRAEFSFSEDEPYFVVAEGRKNKSYLALNSGEQLSLSPFEVSGFDSQGSGIGYMYAERGVWRPGDTVFLNFILHQGRHSGPANQPIICEIYNPTGKRTNRFVQSKSVGGFYSFDFATDKDDLTGNWRAEITVGGVKLSKRLKIEAIKPNRLAVNMDLKSNYSYQSQPIEIPIEVEWLTGAVASKSRVELDAYLKELPISFPEWSSYEFGQIGKKWSSGQMRVFEGTMDDSGKGKFSLDMAKAKASSGPVEVLLTGKAFEPSGDFSIFQRRVKAKAHPVYVGVKMKKSRWHSVDIEKAQTVDVIVVDENGNAMPNRDLEVRIEPHRYRWWWDDSGNRPVYKSDNDRKVIVSDRITSSDEPVSWILPKDKLFNSGFVLWVKDMKSGQLSSQYFYPTSSRWYSSDEKEGPDLMEFEISEKDVEVGQDISIEVPSASGSRLLLTVEAGNEILQSAWADTRDGMTKLSFTTTKEMVPNAYVYVSLIHPYAKTDKGQAIRSYAIENINVTDPASMLLPEIDAPKESNPEEVVELSVSEKNGRAMTYTLNVVDEGLLSLTNFKSPNPNDVFLAKQALGIATWDNYGEIMGISEFGKGRLLAVGGDGEVQGENLKDVNRFKPVVKHLGPFELKAGATEVHRIKLPPYIGNLRVMLVAGNGSAYGHTDRNILVREELMVLSTVPRTLSPGDRFEVPVTSFSMIDKSMDVDLNMDIEGDVEILGSKSQKVKLAGNSSEVNSYMLKAADKEGQAKITINASSGPHNSNHQVEVAVRSQADIITEVLDTILAPQSQWSFEYSPLGMAGNNSGALEFSEFPAMNLAKRTSYLIRYPYGCTEQTASAVWGQIYLSDLADLSAGQKNAIQFYVQEGLDKLSQRQQSNGGMRYWSGSQYVRPWLSAHVGLILQDIKKTQGSMEKVGFADGLLTYLKESSDNWDIKSTDEDEMLQALRLYVLALAEVPALGAMNRMKTRPFKSAAAQACLASAYILSGYEDVGKKLLLGVEGMEFYDGTYINRYHAGTVIGRSLLTTAYLHAGMEEKAAEHARYLAELLGEKRYLNTHQVGWALRGVAQYLNAVKWGGDIRVSVKDGTELNNLIGDVPVITNQISNPDKSRQVIVQNLGSNAVFVRLIKEGRPKRDINIKAQNEGMKMNVTYESLDGEPLDISRIKKGTTFKMRMEVRLLSRGYERDVALDHPIPAGWEIVNSRMEGTAGQNGHRHLLHTDVRDDRIVFHIGLGQNTQVYTATFIATYAGNYYKAPVKASAMYSDRIRAFTESNIIEVVN